MSFYLVAGLVALVVAGFYFKPTETKALFTNIYAWGVVVAAAAVQYFGAFDFTSLFK
jgi:hypothetical protein